MKSQIFSWRFFHKSKGSEYCLAIILRKELYELSIVYGFAIHAGNCFTQLATIEIFEKLFCSCAHDF